MRIPSYVCLCACVCQTFVVVDIQVVWSGEDGDEGGETCSLALPVHTVPEERERDKQDAHVIAGKKKILKKDVVDKNRGFASEVFKPDRDRLKARQPRI